MKRVALAAAIVLSPALVRATTVDECMKSYESAQELKQAHKLVSAREALRVCAQKTCPKVARDDCVPWLAAIETELPTLVFGATCGGKPWTSGTIDVDGAPLTDAMDGLAHDSDPGVHTFTLHTDRGRHEQKVAVREGAKNQPIDFALDASECAGAARDSTPPASGPRSRVPWAIATAGVGVVATGFFAGFGLSGVLRRSDMIHSCFPRCDPDEVSSVRTSLTIADVSWVVAGVSFVAAAIIYFTDPARRSPSQTTGVSPAGVLSF